MWRSGLRTRIASRPASRPPPARSITGHGAPFHADSSVGGHDPDRLTASTRNKAHRGYSLIDGPRVNGQARETSTPTSSTRPAPTPLPERTRHDLYDALDKRYLLRRWISRRHFLQATAAGAVALALASFPLSGCSIVEAILDKIAKRPVRRNVASMAATDPILVTYAAAITAMQARPSSDKRSWAYQADIHANHCPHGNWLFLPWHRAYIYRFEEICREVTGDNGFALPYWNWQSQRGIPAPFLDTASPLYHPRSKGMIDQLPNYMVGGPVLQSILDETNFLRFASGSLALSDSQQTYSRKDPLEDGPHDSLHVWVGNDMGQVNLAARDPLFWLHHNNIEAIWADWNIRLGNPNTNDSAWVDRQFTEFADRSGTLVTVGVPELLLYPLLQYRYDNPVFGGP